MQNHKMSKKYSSSPHPIFIARCTLPARRGCRLDWGIKWAVNNDKYTPHSQDRLGTALPGGGDIKIWGTSSIIADLRCLWNIRSLHITQQCVGIRVTNSEIPRIRDSFMRPGWANKDSLQLLIRHTIHSTHWMIDVKPPPSS